MMRACKASSNDDNLFVTNEENQIYKEIEDSFNSQMSLMSQGALFKQITAINDSALLPLIKIFSQNHCPADYDQDYVNSLYFDKQSKALVTSPTERELDNPEISDATQLPEAPSQKQTASEIKLPQNSHSVKDVPTSKIALSVNELNVEEPPEQGYIPKTNRSLKRSSRVVESVEISEKGESTPRNVEGGQDHKKKHHSRRQLVDDIQDTSEQPENTVQEPPKSSMSTISRATKERKIMPIEEKSTTIVPEEECDDLRVGELVSQICTVEQISKAYYFTAQTTYLKSVLPRDNFQTTQNQYNITVPIQPHMQDPFHKPDVSPPRKAVDVHITNYEDNYHSLFPQSQDSSQLADVRNFREEKQNIESKPVQLQQSYNRQYQSDNLQYEDEIDKIIKLNTVAQLSSRQTQQERPQPLEQRFSYNNRDTQQSASNQYELGFSQKSYVGDPLTIQQLKEQKLAQLRSKLNETEYRTPRTQYVSRNSFSSQPQPKQPQTGYQRLSQLMDESVQAEQSKLDFSSMNTSKIQTVNLLPDNTRKKESFKVYISQSVLRLECGNLVFFSGLVEDNFSFQDGIMTMRCKTVTGKECVVRFQDTSGEKYARIIRACRR